MKIIFNEKYLSIENFNSIDTNDFVILTGINGAGKSHLLKAIEEKKVLIEGLENSNIIYFNYENFRLENEGMFSAQQITQEKESAWNLFIQANGNNIKNSIANWKNSLGGNYNFIKELAYTKNKPLWDLTKIDIGNDSIYELLKQYKNNIKTFFRTNGNIKDNHLAHGILSLIKKLKYSLDEIEKEEFIDKYYHSHFKNDFIPLQLGKIIWDYYIKQSQNEMHEYQNKKYGKSYKFLSTDEFIENNGEKPWEIINIILGKFNTLDYKTNSPEGEDAFGSFKLSLINKTNPDILLDFSNLSSGEKILMALVASIYKSSSDNHFPDILLLDEVDASLHPSMIQNLLDVIKEIFLEKGVKIILVTHSPTTIALSPEESIYLMNKRGLNRIEKASKENALDILTEGFATLDKGIKLFDEISSQNISIITEGNNTNIIKKALELYGITNIDIINGAEGSSGKNQLKTLFEFFTKVSHDKKVIFVWDCDANEYRKLLESNNTIPFVFQKNENNKICLKGIENLFGEDKFEKFLSITTKANGNEIKVFDESMKRNFEDKIISNGLKDDFKNFETLINILK
ncbi:AAA family ATPase [Candidatus Gracilibacteria bacterium]|nr:AAA family ATPase [Candidatus Gracilibacteria bacterium]NUJ99378.1 AAA family ATPase [Candidatus Gracilibacteria bacterium]